MSRRGSRPGQQPVPSISMPAHWQHVKLELVHFYFCYRHCYCKLTRHSYKQIIFWFYRRCAVVHRTDFCQKWIRLPYLCTLKPICGGISAQRRLNKNCNTKVNYFIRMCIAVRCDISYPDHDRATTVQFLVILEISDFEVVLWSIVCHRVRQCANAIYLSIQKH